MEQDGSNNPNEQPNPAVTTSQAQDAGQGRRLSHVPLPPLNYMASNANNVTGQEMPLHQTSPLNSSNHFMPFQQAPPFPFNPGHAQHSNAPGQRSPTRLNFNQPYVPGMPLFMPMIRDQSGQPFHYAQMFPGQMPMIPPAQLQMMQRQAILQQQQSVPIPTSNSQTESVAMNPPKQAPAKKPRQRKGKKPSDIRIAAENENNNGGDPVTQTESKTASPATSSRPKRTRTPTKPRTTQQKVSPAKRKTPARLSEREKEYKRLYEIELKKKEYLVAELEDFQELDTKLTFAVQRRRILNQLIIEHLMKLEREQRLKN